MRSWGVTILAVVISAIVMTGLSTLYAQGVDGDSLGVRSSAAKVVSLNQVVSEVVNNNDRVAAARYMAEAAERKIGPAGAWKDPMLMLGVQNVPTNFDFEMDDMTMKMIGLSQEIPYAGFKGYAKKSAQADAAVAQAEAQSMTIDLVTVAKSAYLDLYYRRLNLTELQRQSQLLDQVVSASSAKLRTSEAGQEEFLAAQADLWRTESMILSAEQEVVEATQNLNTLIVSYVADTAFEMTPPDLPPVPDAPAQWFASAEANYPAFQKLRHQSESYSLSAAAMKRMQWPMLGVNGSYGMRSGYKMGSDGMPEKRDNMISFGVTLSLPLFEGNQQGQAARSMYAMEMASLGEARQLQRDVHAKLQTLYERARRLSLSLALYRDRILPTAEDAYRTALSGYASNRTDFVSLLTLATGVYRDRITVNELANALAQTLIEAERFTTNTGELILNSSSSIE